MSKITTSGQLRDYLCSVINGVGNGTVDERKARSITKLAGQVNESLYSECRVMKLKTELDQGADSFGDLPLGGS